MRAPLVQPLTRRAAAVVPALRVHHWVKNLLVFVPLLLAHEVGDVGRVVAASFAWLAFSLAASCGYILNDLMDREADRRHPRKRMRPLASGALSARHGVLLAAALAVTGFTVALMTLPPLFALELAAYLVIVVVYSSALKRYPVLDVLVLAALYTARVAAGATAVDVPLSPWLASFAMFLFLSLAFVKRHSELVLSVGEGTDRQVRGYQPGDLVILQTLGSTSGYLSILVLALYINSDAVMALYRRPYLLWLILAVLLYWISRLWFRAHRGLLHDDPIVEAARDPISYWVLGAAMLVVIAATM